MKKVFLIIVLPSLILLYFGFFKLNNAEIDQDTIPNEVFNTKSNNHILQKKNKIIYSTELSKLKAIEEQCQSKNMSFSDSVDEIHNELIITLEKELLKGSTIRDLVKYSDQYQTFFKRFYDLIRDALIRKERKNLKVASSVKILTEWNGLSVIEGFTSENINTLIDLLTKNNLDSLSLPLKLAPENINNNFKQLLDNPETFNTYLDQPFSIGGSSAISPSILLVLAAGTIDANEFRITISGHSFTVNDIAVGILNNVPSEHLKILMANTVELNKMPIFVQNKYVTYYNLADLAVSQYNVEALTILKNNGVTPTNEPGIITGLDIAILNLPQNNDLYNESPEMLNKHIETIKFLQKNGYMAHGYVTKELKLTFDAPFSKRYQVHDAIDVELKQLLTSIGLIDKSYEIHQEFVDNSDVSLAIAHLRSRKENLNNGQKGCASVAKDILTAKKLIGKYPAIDEINEIVKINGRNDITSLLHNIDPALVQLWQLMQYEIQYYKKSEFTNFLTASNYIEIQDFVASTPLDQSETEILFQHLMEDISGLMPAWNSRVSPLRLTNLLFLRNASLEQWQLLFNEGFDFSLKDSWDNDVFLPAMLNSIDAVSFLLDNGFKPEFDNIGIDILDLALEHSFEQGNLNQNVFKILALVKNIEPNHYSRIARLREYYPVEYEKLKNNRPYLIPPENTHLNKYQFLSFL
ncbi:hypothetical protein [Thalassotalea sp. ND16A]|uniref:hypothetical protein n=1 Tax=Thalassotalea sp. ND16A TaxID=1535422 RepID=UPI00051A755A|nr:hypothetical protein [Thalassotalea sp. ND16A]KGJ92772.1 hypothetical protein ND16A_1574 [Thalassotalea sp. ND16A]